MFSIRSSALGLVFALAAEGDRHRVCVHVRRYLLVRFSSSRMPGGLLYFDSFRREGGLMIGH